MNTLLSHLALLIQFALFHLVGPVPPDLGVHGGSLSPCQTSAHCARIDWAVSDPAAALSRLETRLATMPSTTVLMHDDGYVHATVSSAFFGFVDDLELFADNDHGILQARSVSRLGDSDLGVNQRRLSELGALLDG